MNQQQILRVKYLVPSVVAVLLIGIAVVLMSFSGPLPVWISQQISVIIPSSVEGVQLLLVVSLTGAGLFYFRQGSKTRDQVGGLISTESPPEVPRNAPQIVGETFDTEMDTALREVRLKDVDYSTTEPQKTLTKTAQSSIQLMFECSFEEADHILRTGEWTTDPVARAFLSDSIEYPMAYQLLRWANPGDAYETAVDRTSLAVEQLLRTGHAGGSPLTGSVVDSETKPTTNWLATVRATLDGYRDSDADSDRPSQPAETAVRNTTDPEQPVGTDK